MVTVKSYLNLLATGFTAGAATGAAVKGINKGGVTGGLETTLATIGGLAVGANGSVDFITRNSITRADFNLVNAKRLKNWLPLGPIVAAYAIGVATGYIAG